MKKKVIRLTESDIEKLVKKILKEDEQLEMNFGDDGHTQDEMNDVWESLNNLLFNTNQSAKIHRAEVLMDNTFNGDSMSVVSFVNHLESHMGYERDYLVSVLEQIKEEGI